jgi:hypothetical protein
LFITENNMFRITPKLFVFLKIKPHWHHQSSSWAEDALIL